MQIYNNPPPTQWSALMSRPQYDLTSLLSQCADVFNGVSIDGDAALMCYAERFDGVKLANLIVTPQEFDQAAKLMSEPLKEAILAAKSNIEEFHRAQNSNGCSITYKEGFRCWQEIRAIERVGIYIPGGTAPLFSTVLMLAVPAQLAGCKEVVLATPTSKDGSIHPAILWSAEQCGVTKIIKLGGMQAIAALAVGTQSVPKVYKIFGPGNQYVMAAKLYAQQLGVAIDLPAGPSEVLVVADKSAISCFVAADLLSQAEHGVDSQSILVTTSKKLLSDVESDIITQLKDLPRAEITTQALNSCRLIAFETMEQCVDFANEYAAEHLILSVEGAEEVSRKIINAGSIFLGNYSPESAGDYASGTNHTLPTAGFAKAYSGVNMDAFVKKITFQQFSREALVALAPTIITMAQSEELHAHSRAVEVRIK